MKNETSRRDFLGISSAGIWRAAVTPKDNGSHFRRLLQPCRKTRHRKPAQSFPFGSRPAMNASAPAPQATWSPSTTAPGAEHIQLNPGVKFQEIVGFGGAFTDAYLLHVQPARAPAREKLFHEMFHPSERWV